MVEIETPPTFNQWMDNNRWTNVKAAAEISRVMTERAGEHRSVTSSMIGQVRKKDRTPSAELATAIFQFTGKEIDLEELLS